MEIVDKEYYEGVIAEWKQGASVEASLRREFLVRAERAEAEIERLHVICQDIIEIIGTEYAQGADGPECIRKIDEIAHRYFIP